MAKPRSPNRDKAHQLWLESGKKQQLKDIAAELHVSEEQVRKWKNQDKWDKVTLPNANGNVTIHKENKYKNNKTAIDEVVHVVNNTDLTDKQQLFCVLYIRCFNATKAYQKAYNCDYRTAQSNGYKLLTNTYIREEIKNLKQNRLNREMLDEHDIFQKYMDIAFADITDFVEFGQEQIQVMSKNGSVEIIDQATGKKRSLMRMENIVHFKKHTETDGTLISEIKQGKNGISIKLLDRMKALQWLSDHMNLATEEQKLRMEKLKNSENIHDDNEIEVQIYLPDNGRKISE